MPKQLNDIKAKASKSNTNKIWLKDKSKSSFQDAGLMPFIFIGLGVFLLFNLLILGQRTQDLKKNIIAYSESGLSSLEQAKESIKNSNWKEAQANFIQAKDNFNALAQEAKLIQTTLVSPKLLSEAGEGLSEAGYILSEVAETLSNLPEQILTQNQLLQEDTEFDIYANSLTLSLFETIPKIEAASKYLNDSIKKLKKINTKLLPEDKLEQFDQGIASLEEIEEKLNLTQDYLPVLLDLMGHEVAHNYLILIQNANEIRSGGGFIGNLVFVEVKQGYLSKLESHSVYDYDGQLVETLSVPPEFEGFVDEIFIRDANYSPDFATSAQKVETLLQRAKSPSFDTIVAVDNYFLSDLLDLTGDLSLNSYPQANISAFNYDIVLNYLEQTSFRKTQVNQEFIQSFREKVFQVDFKRFLPILMSNTKEKHIQLYSKHDTIQDIFTKYNLDSKVPSHYYDSSSNQDYLLVTNTSIGGNKTDKYVSQRLIHRTQILSDGSLVDRITIRRYHGFQETYIQTWKKYLRPFGVDYLDLDLLSILGRGKNTSRLKVYVPKGSKLLNTEGIDFNLVKKIHDPESDLDYFLLEMSLLPGDIQEISLDYTLPFKLKTKPAALYSLLVQTQPGMTEQKFEKEYSLSSDLRAGRYYPQDYTLNESGQYSSEMDLNQDTEFALIYSK